MNKRKYRAEVVKYNTISNNGNEEFLKIRRKEYETNKKRLQLARDEFNLRRYSMEGRTNELKDELKGIYKHCIAEVNKEAEDIEERIKKADIKILELEAKLKE